MNASAKSNATKDRSPFSEKDGRTSQSSPMSDMRTAELFQMDSNCSPADSHALTSALLDSVRDWLGTPLGSGLKCVESRMNVARELSSLKTSPVFSVRSTVKTFRSFLRAYAVFRLEFRETVLKLRESPKGESITSHGELWTAIFSESPSNAAECSLPDVLQPADTIQPKYFLSAKACRGIIRRAKKRGKTLPPHLKDSLESVAGGGGQVSTSLTHKFNGAEQAGRLIVGSQTAHGGGPDDNDATQGHIVSAQVAGPDHNHDGAQTRVVAGSLKSQGMRGFNTDTFPYVSADKAPTMNCHLGDKQGLENQHIDSGGVFRRAKTLTASNQRIDFETETLITQKRNE